MAESNELGTLIVVVGKARNLPNKSRFGKQDPFCTVTVSEDKQRTKAVKRGGQHPEWDEELRFTIMEDVDDVLTRSESQPDTSLSTSTSQVSTPTKDGQLGVTTAAALASKSRKGPLKKRGVKSMRVACYADDAKEPELIGECNVSIEDVLKQGEVDEWYEFLYKDKYSGEVYLELTFYSNNAPPVKRNVPRPSIHAYGGIQPSPSSSSSSSSIAGRHRLSGGLAASGSVSGMSLYIPPYVQPMRAPSPSPTPVPSTSFAELGLPPGHGRKQSLPQHSSHLSSPPFSHTLATQPTHSALDALVRPMTSMSLGLSHPSRPLPAAGPISQASHLGHAMNNHRHSVGGRTEAPWGSLLPQSQPPSAAAPHPRPMSSNDVVPWEQLQRLEEERKTPVPRPISGQGFIPVGAHPYHPDPRVASPVPSSLTPAAPPRTHATIFSHVNGSGGPSRYQHPSPLPTPPPLASSAPPSAPGASHYQVPTSSWAGLSRPPVEPLRMPSPQPGYQQAPETTQPYDPYRTPRAMYQPQDAHLQQAQLDTYGQPPPPSDSHSRYQPAQQPQLQTTYPPQPPQPNPYASSSSSGYSDPPQPAPSPRHPSPAPVPPGGYVPWYQQTQPVGQPNPYQPDQRYDQTYDQRREQYASPLPTASASRPIPHPPAPQRPQSVGYYPSDELYAQQRSQASQPPQTADPWQQQQSYQLPGHFQDQQHYPQSQPFSPPSHSASPSPFSPPPQQYASSSSSQQWQSSTPGYHRAPSPQPPPQNYYNPPQQPPYPSHSNSHPVPRVPSPQPPLHHTHSDPNGWVAPGPSPSFSGSNPRSPSPQPSAKQDWRSYMRNLPGSSLPDAPVRNPSPQPPPKDQQTWYTPPPSLPASIRPPEGWRSTLPAQAEGHSWRG